MNTWPVTLVVAAKNCEDRIEGTLKPWIGKVKSIIVVDQLSTDRTVQIAQLLGAEVVSREAPGGNFDLNRKFGFQQAKTPWILYLDTDERPTPELIAEMDSFFLSPESAAVSGVRIPNDFYFLGRKLRYGIYNQRSSEIRLFRSEAYRYQCEAGLHHGVEVTGAEARFKATYRHFNVNALSEWFVKTNQYTEVDAEKTKTQAKPIAIVVLLFFKFFFRHYFWRRGFLDGAHGFLAVVYFGFYHFTLGSKKWEKQFLKTRTREVDFLTPFSKKER